MADFVEEIERFLASFSPDEEVVTRYAFRAILAGQPATVAELPAAVGLAPEAVEAAVSSLIERGAMVVDPETRRITGARGLALTETCHRLFLEGRPRYAFCAVDAVGIPAALGTVARIDSHCHHCRVPLSVVIQDRTPISDPSGVVIWAVERDLSRSLRAHT
jgi:hypothetical protein